ncbi:hypothetical protein BO79DRAFT_224653 [Aspergillus costaricaensis CBS 115574]|uniref:Uncharacterized protein n=1 Tax=Aspergillus costaricaensis CBS 115574 TaxID=1448317 RepID=A0ACD1IRX1_9EURO|nr:hypothetical protein BO79DRAFT_224653 [Aspergillus costaricaensis CBS 115574]RAK93139.1 hypothetical protein BO79DRAFT_224653 [Aspergillus costaricaensis CBS 115574]
MFGEIGSVGLDAPSLLPSTTSTPIKAWRGNNAGAAHLSLLPLLYWVVATSASVRAIPIFESFGETVELVVQSNLALNIVYTVNMLAFIWSSNFWHLCLNIAKAKDRHPCRSRNAIKTDSVPKYAQPMRSHRCKLKASHWPDADRITNWADNRRIFLPYRGPSANSVCPFPWTIEGIVPIRTANILCYQQCRHFKHSRRLGVSVTTLTSACPDINIVNKLDFSEAGGLQGILMYSGLSLEVATEKGI